MIWPYVLFVFSLFVIQAGISLAEQPAASDLWSGAVVILAGMFIMLMAVYAIVTRRNHHD